MTSLMADIQCAFGTLLTTTLLDPFRRIASHLHTICHILTYSYCCVILFSMRTKHLFVVLLLLCPLVFARAFSTLENIAQLAHQKRQDGNEDTELVTLNFFGCDGTNPRTKNTFKHDITNVWDEVIKIANAITEIDLKKDPGAWDCKWFLC
jgi:hypothetical protein